MDIFYEKEIRESIKIHGLKNTVIRWSNNLIYILLYVRRMAMKEKGYSDSQINDNLLNYCRTIDKVLVNNMLKDLAICIYSINQLNLNIDDDIIRNYFFNYENFRDNYKNLYNFLYEHGVPIEDYKKVTIDESEINNISDSEKIRWIQRDKILARNKSKLQKKRSLQPFVQTEYVEDSLGFSESQNYGGHTTQVRGGRHISTNALQNQDKSDDIINDICANLGLNKLEPNKIWFIASNSKNIESIKSANNKLYKLYAIKLAYPSLKYYDIIESYNKLYPEKIDHDTFYVRNLDIILPEVGQFYANIFDNKFRPDINIYKDRNKENGYPTVNVRSFLKTVALLDIEDIHNLVKILGNYFNVNLRPIEEEFSNFRIKDTFYFLPEVTIKVPKSQKMIMNDISELFEDFTIRKADFKKINCPDGLKDLFTKHLFKI